MQMETVSVGNVWVGAGVLGSGVGSSCLSSTGFPQLGNISISARGSPSALGTRAGDSSAQQRKTRTGVGL